ncbi:hypothetical protein QFZ43_008179 [Streptomyces afghaniensis]|nr:hypothetical protein [Streptomyces afghaniensis]
MAAPSMYVLPRVPSRATVVKSSAVQPSFMPASANMSWLIQRVEPGSGRSSGMP